METQNIIDYIIHCLCYLFTALLESEINIHGKLNSDDVYLKKMLSKTYKKLVFGHCLY